MGGIWAGIQSYFDWFYLPQITWSDVLEIIIIAYLIYHILLWFKRGRAWTLLKGILVLLCFMGVAALLQLNTILYLAKNMINVGIIAIFILFQPELRRALDELGRKQIIKNMFEFNFNEKKEDKYLSDKTIYELVKTSFELGRAKTGALIVLEHDTPLGEFVGTGIRVDAVVTEQLLVNIFEKNTPLHDGAVIISSNRVIAATCYLPLTERNDVNKELGTRHRAGLGISEISDSMTIIVSEETGAVSIAHKGTIYRNLNETELRNHLSELQNKITESPKKHFVKRKKGGQQK